MNIFFLLNNLHFAVEVLGSLVFLIVAWLAFDALLLRKDLLTASRGAGFLFLAVWQIFHAYSAGFSLPVYFGFLFYVAGLTLVFLNLILEGTASRPKVEAILLLPAAATAAFYVNAAAAVFYLAITYLAFRQYKNEFKTSLKPFWIGFLFLFGGASASVFYGADSFGPLWTLGHALELAGFAALIWWSWQFLQLRVREEMVLIFVSASLLISIIVTLAFSIILVGQIENSTKANLLTNARVLDLYIGRLKEEALAKTRLLAETGDLADFLDQGDFAKLETAVSKYLENENLGFLIVLDDKGNVVLRAHALTQKEDNLSDESAVAAALVGGDFVTIESSPAEKFSIRAASPLKIKNKIVGAVVGGFLLDNALVDNIKRVTGLEMSVLEGNVIAATTILNPDGRTRGVGIKITNKEITSAVLERGEEAVLRTEILSRPALVSYLPIKNHDGENIGMVSSLKPQQDILDLANAANRLTLITVAVLMLILALPIYLLTKRLSEEV